MTTAHFTTTGHPIWGKATPEEHIAYETRRAQNRCLYFNGVQHNQCDGGVPYWPQGPQPCWRDTVSPHTCPLQLFPSAALARHMAEAEVREMQGIIDSLRTRSANNQCLHCGEPWTTRRQVGPCIYAEPCGHRQGQGRLPKKEKTP
jgi:hypothetical protein